MQTLERLIKIELSIEEEKIVYVMNHLLKHFLKKKEICYHKF